MSPQPIHPPRSFSLTEGGPFHHLLVRLGIRAAGSMSGTWWLSLVVWTPLGVVGALPAAFGSRVDPILFDLAVHVRLLFSLPVFLLTEQLLETNCRSAVASFYQGRFCEPARVDSILARAERMRDSWIVEAALLAVAVAGGQLAFWGVFGATGLFHGGAMVQLWSFPRVWYTLIALPLFQFVMFRWLWRWLIWSIVLARLSRLPLFPLATHADYAGGLGPLNRPVTGFSGFVVASAAILAAAWGTQVVAGQMSVEGLLPELLVLLLVALAIALGPLLPFCPHLFRVRRRGLAQYGDFVRKYTLDFHDKWIVRAGRENPMGSPDIQSLNDLGEAFQVVSQTRIFVFGPRVVAMVLFSALVPMVPLFASQLTIQEVLKRLVGSVFGLFPL